MPTIMFVSGTSQLFGERAKSYGRRQRYLAGTSGLDVIVSVKQWDDAAERIRQLENAGCHVFRRPDDSTPRVFYELPRSELRDRSLERIAPDLVVISQGDNVEGLGWMEHCIGRDCPYVTITHQVSEYEWPRDHVARRLRLGYLGTRAAYFVSADSVNVTERLTLGVRCCRDLAERRRRIPLAPLRRPRTM